MSRSLTLHCLHGSSAELIHLFIEAPTVAITFLKMSSDFQSDIHMGMKLNLFLSIPYHR
jgi:hypothetical protein